MDYQSTETYKTILNFTKQYMKDNDKSHGIEHVERVCETAIKIYNMEKERRTFPRFQHEFDEEKIIIVSSITHDILDHKYIKQDGDLYKKIKEKMNHQLRFIFVFQAEIDAVWKIIDNVSFSKEKEGNLEKLNDETRFLRDIVSDADKIDALGVDGIERCKIYERTLNLNAKEEEVITNVVTHCKEKLLLLKHSYIRTVSGKLLAIEPHKEIVHFVTKNSK